MEEYQKKHEINMDEDVNEDEFDDICGKKDHEIDFCFEIYQGLMQLEGNPSIHYVRSPKSTILYYSDK